MTISLADPLDRALSELPRRYPGPGGAVAVLRDGAVLARHAWGWANAERRIPFTPRSLFRLCSITKQFTCALLLDLHPDPAALDGDVRARLPLLEGVAPGTLHLAHNQSGLRDYWAVAMLLGAPAESDFGGEEAAAVIGGTRTLQFAPGTRYSYSNGNFRLLSDIMEARAGRSFAELLRERVFGPAGMEGAILAADTRALPDGTEGYEGQPADGFRPAVNRVLWTGDAGLGASLDDVIAWERHLDATRDDEASLYRRLSAPVFFADGAPSAYGFGLARHTQAGRAVTGHGGALRGWRSHRLYVPSERVSVVVMFNHLADARAAALDLLAAVLGEDRAPPPVPLPMPDWLSRLSRIDPRKPAHPSHENRQDFVGEPMKSCLGAYVEPETGLAVRLEAAEPGQVDLRFVRSAERLDLQPDGTALGRDGTRLRPGDGGLWLDRPDDNQSSLLCRCGAADGARHLDLSGRYRCAELDAELTVSDAGGVLYGAFSGALGRGRMELLDPVAPDVLTLPCPRALDHTPPGDWTLAFRRDAAGRVAGVEVGCWLARRLSYARVGAGG